MSVAPPLSRSRLGKVVIVNTADAGGGAERTAMLTLEGFEALGTETWLAVGAKHTDHRRVVPFHLSSHIDYSSHAAPRQRSALRVQRLIASRLGLEDFDHPYSRYLLGLTGSTPDLVLCHNLHGGFFDLRLLPSLTHRIPVVLRLSDSWLFSGHCACPRGCPRWETGCGSCPDLSIPPAVQRDATALNWRRKQRILAASRLFVAAPSRWLLDRAQRSLLGPAIEGARMVPDGIELDVFTPGSQSAARRRLGIRPDRHVLLFAATSGHANPYKDFPTIRSAVARLSDERDGTPLELLVVGNEGPDEALGGAGRVRHLPYCGSRSRLADFYRAADLYVHAAPEESFGLTVAEALACGTAVVAAAGGGISEVVDDGRTGLLVAPGRPDALAAAVRGLLDDPGRRQRMGAAAARSARPRLGRQRMVAELHAWCEEVAERWHPGAAESSAPRRSRPAEPAAQALARTARSS
jgi:glycosyltransferase involved in cell wall biosynthesis